MNQLYLNFLYKEAKRRVDSGENIDDVLSRWRNLSDADKETIKSLFAKDEKEER